MKLSLASASLSVLALASSARALDVIGYWGVHGAQVGEKSLGYYCDTGAYTIINLSFIDTLTNPRNISINMPAADPSNGDIIADIKHCQSKGIKIFASIGGYIANIGISDAATGEAYADGLWNSYMGGKDTSYPRPFGSSVVLDGIDLDLEQPNTAGYVALVNKLKKTMNASGRKYYIAAAPQCGIPDPNMDTLLKSVWFDYISPQFYNNWCYFTGPNFNYDTVNPQFGQDWVAFASNFKNPNTKLLLGVPAPNGGNGGDADVLPKVQSVVPDLARKHPGLFGGVMFWDCFWAGPAWAKSVRATVDAAGGGSGNPPPPPTTTTVKPPSTTTTTKTTAPTATPPSTVPTSGPCSDS
ncbi:Chitinase 2, partial [Borealophlyctis nickersoniae]